MIKHKGQTEHKEMRNLINNIFPTTKINKIKHPHNNLWFMKCHLIIFTNKDYFFRLRKIYKFNRNLTKFIPLQLEDINRSLLRIIDLNLEIQKIKAVTKKTQDKNTFPLLLWIIKKMLIKLYKIIVAIRI